MERMESGAGQAKTIEGDKAQRIIDAMRSSVGRRGVAGSTFDHVAREAGVSRGLLHYYFGTKERLLAEVVRRDCDVRMELLEAQLSSATSAAALVELLRLSLMSMLEADPEFMTLLFELFTVSRHNDELAAEFAELTRRTREHVGGLLAAKQAEGVLVLRADPGAVADLLFAMADGIALRLVAEPDRDFTETVEAAVAAAQALICDAM
jgi:AcrR family transcriptional regulator